MPIRVINPDSQSFANLSNLKDEITSQLGDKVSDDPDLASARLWIQDDTDVTQSLFGVMQYRLYPKKEKQWNQQTVGMNSVVLTQ